MKYALAKVFDFGKRFSLFSDCFLCLGLKGFKSLCLIQWKNDKVICPQQLEDGGMKSSSCTVKSTCWLFLTQRNISHIPETHTFQSFTRCSVLWRLCVCVCDTETTLSQRWGNKVRTRREGLSRSDSKNLNNTTSTFVTNISRAQI